MNRLFESFRNLFRIPDLRNRVLFTLALLAVYRIGAHIPTPGINTRVLESLFQQGQGSVLGIFDLFSGGNLRRLTIFALGIMPYITASIILQLLTVVYEPLAKLQKEGEMGRKKITQWTRYLTVVLSAVQSFGIAISLEKAGDFVNNPGPGFVLMTMLTLTTGSAFIMWLGEQITERGVGNGMSLLIFAGIVVGLPRGVVDLIDKAKNGAWGALTPVLMAGLVIFMIAVVAFFAYFYVSIVFNPSEVADNMRKYGGFIPGIRPGKRTADFINEVLTRITLVGALYLIIISFIPEWMITGIHLNHLYGPVGRFFEGLPNWMTNGLGVNFYFGGTSLLIVVGVAMDTVTQIEAQLIMRHYEGFSPRSGRIRGRRTWS